MVTKHNKWNLQWPKTQELPAPRREVSRDTYEFYRLFDDWIEKREYDQVFIDGDFYSIWYEWSEKRGLVVAKRYMFQHNFTQEVKPKHPLSEFIPDNRGGMSGTDPMGYACRYFILGCEHKLREISNQEAGQLKLTFRRFDSFDHIYYCDKCGYNELVNSSD